MFKKVLKVLKSITSRGFYISSSIYLFLLVLTPLFFDDPMYNVILQNGSIIQRLCLLFCIFYYIKNPTNRSEILLLLIGLIDFYGVLGDKLLHNINALYYLIESLFFFSCGMFVTFHPEIKTAKTIDKKNILLAFYKGRNGSFIMRFSSFFGFNVKSMCILAGDKALYLKQNKETFVFGDSDKILRKSDEYHIVDTGNLYTKEFIKEMKKYTNTKAKAGFFRIRCISAVKDLLEKIGKEYKPTLYLPSLYLRKVLNVSNNRL